jgi:hypothetical protein
MATDLTDSVQNIDELEEQVLAPHADGADRVTSPRIIPLM